MLKIFICCRNRSDREALESIINERIIIEDYNMEIGLSTDNPYRVLDKLRSYLGTGVYFLDTKLSSDIDGVELARRIRSFDIMGAIIFITSEVNREGEVFEHHIQALDYIVKDNHTKVNSRVSKCMKSIQEIYLAREWDAQGVFSVKVGDGYYNISYDNIVLFKTSLKRNKVVLHTSDRKIVEFYGSIKSTYDSLDDSFCRCHESSIINLKQIHKVDKVGMHILMKNNIKVPISRRSLKRLQEMVEDTVVKGNAQHTKNSQSN